jgi:hypothetical protein
VAGGEGREKGPTTDITDKADQADRQQETRERQDDMPKKRNWKTRDFDQGQLTFWGNANDKIRSQYGCISYLLWCRLEADRIARISGSDRIRRDAYVRRNGTVARVALFLGKPAAHDHKVLHIGGSADCDGSEA